MGMYRYYMVVEGKAAGNLVEVADGCSRTVRPEGQKARRPEGRNGRKETKEWRKEEAGGEPGRSRGCGGAWNSRRAAPRRRAGPGTAAGPAPDRSAPTDGVPVAASPAPPPPPSPSSAGPNNNNNNNNNNIRTTSF